ncbi:Hypothetical protein MVR_LOCUS58 [uncultured virus]|nr:Hypothetical protein MVR_LOCUS58 [uncultured virus]
MKRKASSSTNSPSHSSSHPSPTWANIKTDLIFDSDYWHLNGYLDHICKSTDINPNDITSFQCHGIKLSKLSLKRLPNLTSLDASGCDIGNDLKAFFDLVQLKSLNISNTNINSVQGINNLTNLTKLVFNNSTITGSIEQTQILALLGLHTLSELDIENSLFDPCNTRSIEHLIKHISNPNLIRLNMALNPSVLKNESVLPMIVTHVSLTHLDLRRNGIKTLPSEFANLINLETLDLSYNDLTNISPLSALLKLKWLSLAGNRVHLDPVTSLVNLEHLDITQVHDIAAVEKFRVLSKLQSINLNCNNINATSTQALAHVPVIKLDMIGHGNTSVVAPCSIELATRITSARVLHDEAILQMVTSHFINLQTLELQDINMTFDTLDLNQLDHLTMLCLKSIAINVLFDQLPLVSLAMYNVKKTTHINFTTGVMQCTMRELVLVQVTDLISVIGLPDLVGLVKLIWETCDDEVDVADATCKPCDINLDLSGMIHLKYLTCNVEANHIINSNHRITFIGKPITPLEFGKFKTKQVFKTTLDYNYYIINSTTEYVPTAPRIDVDDSSAYNNDVMLVIRLMFRLPPKTMQEIMLKTGITKLLPKTKTIIKASGRRCQTLYAAPCYKIVQVYLVSLIDVLVVLCYKFNQMHGGASVMNMARVVEIVNANLNHYKFNPVRVINHVIQEYVPKLNCLF